MFTSATQFYAAPPKLSQDHGLAMSCTTGHSEHRPIPSKYYSEKQAEQWCRCPLEHTAHGSEPPYTHTPSSFGVHLIRNGAQDEKQLLEVIME